MQGSRVAGPRLAGRQPGATTAAGVVARASPLAPSPPYALREEEIFSALPDWLPEHLATDNDDDWNAVQDAVQRLVEQRFWLRRQTAPGGLTTKDPAFAGPDRLKAFFK